MNLTSTITREEIAQRAHDIWEQCGRPEGQETEHWLRAERELRQERGQADRISQRDSAPGFSADTNGGRSENRRTTKPSQARR